jgi:hypothetical protein
MYFFAFAWKNLENPRKTSVRVSGLRAEVSTQNILDAKHVSCPLAREYLGGTPKHVLTVTSVT